MENKTIRSRRPLRLGQSGTHSPPHGSPIRNARHLSPNLSGSDDDEREREKMELDFPDTTASLNSTMDSSRDDADGEGLTYRYSQTKEEVQFYPNGNVRELRRTKIKENISLAKKEEPCNYTLLWLIVVIAILGTVGCFTMYHRYVAAEPRTLLTRCSFELSEREFPNQDKILWKSLEYGVESVLNDIPTSPSIFLLAYEDVKSVNRITRSIVQRTTECMNSKVNALELSPADLAYNEMKTDYGVVITKYQNQLKKSGVMLVNDLNKVPSEVAPAFHVFCDVHNPLVDRSIIFLTLQLTRQIHASSGINTLQLVENYLRSNWSELDNFILEPLITRVTDQVFILNNE